MKLKDKLSESHLLLFVKLLPYMLREYWTFSLHVARCSMSRNSEKLLTDILMTTHAVEKAFSLYDKRKGFGVAKIVSLMARIKKYVAKYGYSYKIDVALALIHSYLNYQEECGFTSEVLEDVSKDLQKLMSANRVDAAVLKKAGYISVSKEEILRLTSGADFRKLAANRHSFRHFSKEEVSEAVIKEALEIANYAPSACNRQAYRVHVFSREKKDRILQIQSGASSFYKEADKAILITGDLQRYYTTEMHLPYVDASLFCMSLIYAFTSLGIASIPLTMGRKLGTLNSIQKEMNIPTHEVPVILIAIGHYPEEASLSLSYRNCVDTFTTFHK